jgi:hypothetical protein
MQDLHYGEWELGTYTCGWRFVQDGAVVCGSQEIVDSNEELDKRVRRLVQPGRILAIEMPSPLDVRVILDNMRIDFLAISSDSADDELFHIFGPDSVYVEYSISGAWKLGRSDAPWT